MSLVRRYFNFVFALALGAGVLFAQVCNVLCVTADCAEDTKVVTSPQSASHCHQEKSAPQPEPAPNSHDCQTHDLTAMLAASGSQLDTISQAIWHPVAVIPAQLELRVTRSSLHRTRLSALRSPPRVPQKLILRI